MNVQNAKDFVRFARGGSGLNMRNAYLVKTKLDFARVVCYNIY